MTSNAEMLAPPFNLIPKKKVLPLWLGWIAKRHVTLMVAPGGTGKGLTVIDLTARVTTGRAFPDEPEGTVHEPEAVVLVAPEDDPNETVAWRLDAAGADSSLVFNLTVFPDGTWFKLPDHIPQLRAAIEEIEAGSAFRKGVKVGMVAIDPLFACTSRPLTTNIAARRVVEPLEILAMKTEVAVLLTHHTVKSGATAGAKGLTDAVRCVLRISRPDPKDTASRYRILSVEKANNMGEAATLRYCISGEGPDTCLTWMVEAEKLAAELSSRGYDIDPDLASDHKPEPKQPVTFELFQTGPDHSATSLGKFETSTEARKFAEKAASFTLTWKNGPIEGSSGAMATKNGKFGYYSVIPVSY